MKFGPIPTGEAAGAILAHAKNVPATNEETSQRFKKGRILSQTDIDLLLARNIREVIVASLDPDDVHEDQAAQRIATPLDTANLTVGTAFTGRVNIASTIAGVIRVDTDIVNALNLIDPAITLATVADFASVEVGQIVATLKIIPFAASESSVAKAEALLSDNQAIALSPYRTKEFSLIQTCLPTVKKSVMDKTASVIGARISRLGGTMHPEERCDHDEKALSQSLRDAKSKSTAITIVVGASAITDVQDVIPNAIRAAGGTVTHFGMPVDPGNLLLIGSIGNMSVIGAPGCVRSPKLNGADWVLERLAADIPISPTDIAKMGVGGLLKDIPSRPLPRAEAITGSVESIVPKIACILLAAGQSRRMGQQNKLLLPVNDRSMVTLAAEAITGSQVQYRLAVVGHQADLVRDALSPFKFDRFVENSEFADGLSTSLKVGLTALPEDIDAAIICLGDMPDLRAEDIGRLIAAFDPTEGRAICVPTFKGKRGNPVLFARRFFDEMKDVTGDAGARHLIGANQEVVVEVEMETGSILKDIDTPESYDALNSTDAHDGK